MVVGAAEFANQAGLRFANSRASPFMGLQGGLEVRHRLPEAGRIGHVSVLLDRLAVNRPQEVLAEGEMALDLLAGGALMLGEIFSNGRSPGGRIGKDLREAGDLGDVFG